MSRRVFTKKLLAKIMIRKAIIGDISMPMLSCTGNIFLIGYRIGSVVLFRNWTTGLYGSGFTQLIKALIRISQ